MKTHAHWGAVLISHLIEQRHVSTRTRRQKQQPWRLCAGERQNVEHKTLSIAMSVRVAGTHDTAHMRANSS
jgi:hypothetical protein